MHVCESRKISLQVFSVLGEELPLKIAVETHVYIIVVNTVMNYWNNNG